jgi:hypothetical protein
MRSEPGEVFQLIEDLEGRIYDLDHDSNPFSMNQKQSSEPGEGDE